MKIVLRVAQDSDFPFLREMLYEAVFWRPNPDKPSLEEGLAYPDVSNALADWGGRDGDTAVVASHNSSPVGAAWYRYWTDDNFIRGFIDEITPVLVIGVQRDYRQQGIGTKLIAWLVDHAEKQGIQNISLMVSKDNHAMQLYRKSGFTQYADKDHSLVMIRKV